jgi:phosphate transport system substrate-binding protein
MNKKLSLFFAIMFLSVTVLSACANQSATEIPAATNAAATEAATADTLSGNITISGAFALYPMMTRWAEEYQKIHPNVTFDVSGGGAGKGMTDALSGAVDIGMVSRSVTDEETAQGAYTIPVVKDAVFPVVNAANPVADKLKATGITQAMFVKIFVTGEVTTWGEVVGDPTITDEIHVYTRSDSCGAADIWAKFLGGKQDDLQGIGVDGDPGLLQAVIADPLGIGYNNLGYAFDLTTGLTTEGALIVPIDINNDGVANDDEIADSLEKAVELIKSEKYPQPPARVENLVTNGKPTGLVADFIYWILTDGQQFVSEAGYVQLTNDQLNTSMGLVK